MLDYSDAMIIFFVVAAAVAIFIRLWLGELGPPSAKNEKP